LIIGFRVTFENVRDFFLEHSVYNTIKTNDVKHAIWKLPGVGLSFML